MDKTQIINIIKNIIREIYKKDKHLFENNVNERTITGNFACYLKNYKKFVGYNVDCEYNRNGKGVKACGEYYQTYPDIIIHKRGKNNNIEDGPNNNILIIETKKRSSEETEERDIKKIKCFIKKDEGYGYIFGCFIFFGQTIKDTYFIFFTENEEEKYIHPFN